MEYSRVSTMAGFPQYFAEYLQNEKTKLCYKIPPEEATDPANTWATNRLELSDVLEFVDILVH